MRTCACSAMPPVAQTKHRSTIDWWSQLPHASQCACEENDAKNPCHPTRCPFRPVHNSVPQLLSETCADWSMRLRSLASFQSPAGLRLLFHRNDVSLKPLHYQTAGYEMRAHTKDVSPGFLFWAPTRDADFLSRVLLCLPSWDYEECGSA
ncbi:hypothetical protein BC834DRAFT_148933 [Gloeopeniophorella convolvens]|nr:hypothetical protein BC834DRAFT_148933 [Gloeopeniophorella convolvens]